MERAREEVVLGTQARRQFPPRISLIATFYNAAAYLDCCVRSLLAQTHSDYEIILVDDGSGDGTFSMLERYADGEQVRCFTKNNGGAGNARNFGVSKARGEYVSFVDGDDFVSPYYLEALDLALTEYGCSMAVGVPVVLKQTEVDSLVWDDTYLARMVVANEAILMLAYEELTESPCCKLAPRWLYEDVPFPERWYEDVAVAGRHYLATGDFAFLSVPVYAYVMNPGSVVNRRNAPVVQLEDFVWAIDEFLAPIEDAYPRYESALAFRRALECSRAHSLAVRVDDDPDRAAVLDDGLVSQVRAAFPKFRDDPRVSWAQKVRFLLLQANPRLYDVVFGLYERTVKSGRA